MGGAPDPVPRRVDSRVRFPCVAGEVVAAVAWWNNGAGGRSPPRRRPSGRNRRASGGLSPWIGRSVGVSCSSGDFHGGGGDRRREILSPVPVFVEVWLLLAILRGFWGWCDVLLVPRAGSLRRLYRRKLGLVSGCCLARFWWCGSSACSSGDGAGLEEVWGFSPAYVRSKCFASSLWWHPMRLFKSSSALLQASVWSLPARSDDGGDQWCSWFFFSGSCDFWILRVCVCVACTPVL